MTKPKQKTSSKSLLRQEILTQVIDSNTTVLPSYNSSRRQQDNTARTTPMTREEADERSTPVP